MATVPTIPKSINKMPDTSLNDYINRWDEIYRFLGADLETIFIDFVRRDGTLPLTGNWDVGGFSITNINNVDADTAHLGGDVSYSQFETDGMLVMPKTENLGIQVDPAAPTFGWRDLLGPVTYRGVGATDPTLAVYRGGIKQFRFAVNDEGWFEFHIPHDYVADTDIFVHHHWSHNSAIVTGGSVTWGYEVIYAKGHNQAAFSAPITPTLVSNASTTQYQHMLDDLQLSAASPSGTQLDSNDLEPDGVIVVRAHLSANNITSSGAVPDPFIHYVDIHYQSTNIATKQRTPDFYT